MIQNFKVDQTRTFSSVLLLGVEPKTAFGDPYRQETAKDGTPNWVDQLRSSARSAGRSGSRLTPINIGVASEKSRREPHAGYAGRALCVTARTVLPGEAATR
ncbi:MAG: hypothetical protein ACRDRK_02775 [Pseudonocardia sp.]